MIEFHRGEVAGLVGNAELHRITVIREGEGLDRISHARILTEADGIILAFGIDLIVDIAGFEGKEIVGQTDPCMVLRRGVDVVVDVDVVHFRQIEIARYA